MVSKDGLTFQKQCLTFLILTTKLENNADKGKIFSIKDGLIISILKLIDKNGPLKKKEKYLIHTKYMGINGKLLQNN